MFIQIYPTELWNRDKYQKKSFLQLSYSRVIYNLKKSKSEPEQFYYDCILA